MKKILDMKKMGALALGLMAFAPAAMAQDEVETSIGADIVSQYYWRGQDLGAVSLQPTLGIGYKGLSLTAWGSVGLSQRKMPRSLILPWLTRPVVSISA